jgi:threonine synthase
VDGDIVQAGRIAGELARLTGAFNLATLREPYRVEGKKTMLLEIWEALAGLPDWILFPTGGGTGIAGMWKALHELRDLGWYDGPWPRFAVVQAEGCAPLVKAWKEGRDRAEPWPDPRTEAAGLRVPSTLADRIVLTAIRETRGAAVAVSEDAMRVSAQNLAAFEGISACLEGAATLAGLRRLFDDGVITGDDRVVLVNTGTARGSGGPVTAPVVRDAAEALRSLGISGPTS